MDTKFDPTPDTARQTADEALAALAVVSAETPKVAKPPRRPQLPAADVALHLQLLPAVVTPGYATRYVNDLVLNSTPQRAVLKLLTASLIAQQAELNDGSRIVRPQQAVQWLLDQIAIGLPSRTLDQIMEGAE